MGDDLSAVRRERKYDRLRVAAWSTIIALGAVYAWAARNEMNPDGISYLDMADAYARGDWHMAVNRLWSPLYPALIAMALRIVHPSSFWEFPTVHLLDFFIYLGALASFEFFLIQLIRYHRNSQTMLSSARTAMPEWVLRFLGYTLFAYSSLELIHFPMLTPDLCVAATVYLASGFLLKIALRPEGRLGFPLLGVVLGVGYLAKAPMFPLAFVFLVLGSVIVCRRCSPFGASLRILASLVGLAIFVGLLVVAFRATYGRWTLGDSGKLNYAWHVDGLPYAHWQGGFPGSGRPIHPTREISSSPPIYEFATPVGGTYPPWYDPAYWYEGVRAHFDAKGQEHALVRSAGVLLLRVFALQTSFAITGGLFLYLGRRAALFVRCLTAYYILLIPAVTAFGIFSLIHLEPRFVAPFVTLFWLALFASIPWSPPDSDQRSVRRLLVALLVMLTISTFTDLNGRSYSTVLALRGELFRREDSHLQWTVAQGLQAIGVQRGDGVAFIGYSFGAYWARLAKARIVAEMPACVYTPYSSTCVRGQPDGVMAFLAADPATRNRILKVFARTRAKVAVIRLDQPVLLQGWQRIAGTNYYAYPLEK